jgi:hypothetical protein
MVFTLELNNRTLVFNEIFLAFQIDPIILNAVLAFPILMERMAQTEQGGGLSSVA